MGCLAIWCGPSKPTSQKRLRSFVRTGIRDTCTAVFEVCPDSRAGSNLGFGVVTSSQSHGTKVIFTVRIEVDGSTEGRDRRSYGGPREGGVFS